MFLLFLITTALVCSIDSMLFYHFGVKETPIMKLVDWFFKVHQSIEEWFERLTK